MKIRHGFVSNSSSTSYTVVVNADYVATFDEIVKADDYGTFCDNYELDYSDFSAEQKAETCKEVNDALQTLREGRSIWGNYHHLLDLPGLHILSSMETGSGGGQMVGVSAETMHKVVAAMFGEKKCLSNNGGC